MVDFLPSKQTVWVQVPLSAIFAIKKDRGNNSVGRVYALQA